MLGADFLALPVHAGRPLVINLHAIHAHVALAGLGIAGHYTWEGDETSPIVRPALQYGEIEQRKVIALDDFLAGAGLNRLGKELSHFRQHGKHFYFVEKALRRFDVHEVANAIGDFVECVHFKREVHAQGRTELVDQYLRSRVTLNVLEKQRRAAGIALLIAAFGNAIRDFRDFEDGVNFGADLFQFTSTVEGCDPVA